MRHYRKNKKDAASGARFSITTLRYGKDNDRILYRGWIRRGGSEWRVSAQTREDCEAKIKDKLAELEREGVSAAVLSVEQKRDAAKARKLLADGETLENALKELQVVREVLGAGRRLLDALDEVRAVREVLGGRATARAAAEFWAVRNPSGPCATLGEARDAYMRALAKRSGSYRRTVAYRLEALVAALDGKTPLPSLGPEMVGGVLTDWAESHSPFSDASWNAWLGTFGGFFKWAAKTYKLASNPSAGLEKREVEESEIGFLHAEDVEKLLRAAEEVAPEYAAAVAILFFAGLRPAELVGQYEGLGEGVRGGLDWDYVDVDDEIFIAGRDTKNRRQRQVPISDNLRAWLDAYGGDKRGRLVPNPQAWKVARKAIVEAAGVDWPQDYARHTYASMHYAFHKDRARLEASMGHDPASRVLEANYKRPVRKSEAERFWSIMPTATAAEVVK